MYQPLPGHMVSVGQPALARKCMRKSPSVSGLGYVLVSKSGSGVTTNPCNCAGVAPTVLLPAAALLMHTFRPAKMAMSGPIENESCAVISQLKYMPSKGGDSGALISNP